MTDTRVRTAALFALLLGAAAAPAREQPVKGANDGAKLVGEWQAVSGERAGKPMTAKECEEFRIVIDERHLSYVYVGSVQSFRHVYSLDPKADPKAIDLTTKDTRRQFGYKAIYALDGGTLKICVGQLDGKRPGEFATKADGPGYHLYVLKRR